MYSLFYSTEYVNYERSRHNKSFSREGCVFVSEASWMF